MPDPSVWLEAGAKVLLYAPLLLAVGACALRWLLLPRVAADLGGARLQILEQSAAGCGLWAAICALVACLIRVWTHTVAAFGLADASLDNLRLIAFQSRWGQSWKLQVLAAAILLVAFAFTAARRKAWPFATLAALLFTATIPLLGHAAGDFFRVALHTVHILAAGIWLGTLGVVFLVRMPSGEPDSIAPPHFAQHVRKLILRQFWPVALPSAATAVAAGSIAAYIYVGEFSNLWTTAYGRILLVKVALVGGITGCGFVNWQRLRRLHSQELRLFGIVVLELILAGAVVLATGLLTETGHPG